MWNKTIWKYNALPGVVSGASIQYAPGYAAGMHPILYPAIYLVGLLNEPKDESFVLLGLEKCWWFSGVEQPPIKGRVSTPKEVLPPGQQKAPFLLEFEQPIGPPGNGTFTMAWLDTMAPRLWPISLQDFLALKKAEAEHGSD